jgi:uncharacterized membrane protein YidH (DUF202 family)
MSLKTLLAMLLIAVGIIAFAYEGLSYRLRETAIELGSFRAERSHQVPLPPVAGALAIGVGILLLVIDVRKLATAGARS